MSEEQVDAFRAEAERIMAEAIQRERMKDVEEGGEFARLNDEELQAILDNARAAGVDLSPVAVNGALTIDKAHDLTKGVGERQRIEMNRRYSELQKRCVAIEDKTKAFITFVIISDPENAMQQLANFRKELLGSKFPWP
jgi:hypothetical protein